jgi:hypothetical protein
VVLRVRGSTGSLGKLTLPRDCGVSWRYQAIAQFCAFCSLDRRKGKRKLVLWGMLRRLTRLLLRS